MRNKRKPTHPGVLFKEEVLEPLGMTITEAAKNLGISRKNLSEFINERISLSPDMAIRISKATKTSPESWLGMQVKLNIWESEALIHKLNRPSYFRARLMAGLVSILAIAETSSSLLRFMASLSASSLKVSSL